MATKPKTSPASRIGVSLKLAPAAKATPPSISNTAQSVTAASADNILRTAAATIMQRGAERDNANGGERSMAATVAAFNAIEGTQLTERQGWAFMQTLKLVRAATSSRNGKLDMDSHMDGAAYAALCGEAASKEIVAHPQHAASGADTGEE